MSLNSSSTSDNLWGLRCSSQPASLISTTLTTIKSLLMLLLCSFILYLGFRRWRRRQSLSTVPSHSDFFTYHLAVMELVSVFGFICYLLTERSQSFAVVMTTICVSSLCFYGEVFFHVLTCVEWYLAVVHPVTYMTLRNTSGCRIRNICIACVWLLCFAIMSLYAVVRYYGTSLAVLCILSVSIMVTSFCCVSALWVLIRPGPGEGGGVKEQVSQSRLKAFYTITAISSVLWLWFIGVLVSSALNLSSLLDQSLSCVLMSSTVLFNLPTCLVSPLLYLHREGKLPCCASE